MKKMPAVYLALALALLALAASCGGPKPAKDALPTEAPARTAIEAPTPVIDSSQSVDIDTVLKDYDDTVTQYLADKTANNADGIAASETLLASLGERLATLATNFSPEQLAKYNEITARLDN